MAQKLSLLIYGLVSLLFLSLLIVGVLSADTETQKEDLNNGIFVYAGAGLKLPVQEAADTFSKKTGIPVDVNFAGAGSLLTQMELTHMGDVFIPGGQPDYALAQEKALVGEPVNLAYHVPVLAVQKGNPKNINSVTDLANPGLKVALGDVKATAIGKASESILEKAAMTPEFNKNVMLTTTTINELSLALESGQIDATILSMDLINPLFMDIIEIPQSLNKILTIPAGITTFSNNQASAAEFIAYISSDEGKQIFLDHGFPSYPNATYEE